MTTHGARTFDDAPRLLDVNGRQLCVRVRGGGPTVVLEGPGTGAGIDGSWGADVERGLLRTATVLEYDRAGVGHSRGRPRTTIEQMADDLHATVRASGVPRPAVFVGWSYGCLVLAMHAIRRPDDIAGLVLIDPTPAAPAPIPTGIRQLLQLLGVAGIWATAAASALGLFRTRLGKRLIARSAGENPTPQLLRAAAGYFGSPREIASMARMLRHLERHQREVSQALDGAAASLDVPTVVLAAGVRPPNLPTKHREHLDASHRRLAALSSVGQLVVADRAGHQVPYEQPEIVLEQIANVLAGVR